MLHIEQGIIYVLKWHRGDKAYERSAMEGDRIRVALQAGVWSDFENGTIVGTLKSVSMDSFLVSVNGKMVPVPFGDVEDITKL